VSAQRSPYCRPLALMRVPSWLLWHKSSRVQKCHGVSELLLGESQLVTAITERVAVRLFIAPSIPRDHDGGKTSGRFKVYPRPEALSQTEGSKRRASAYFVESKDRWELSPTNLLSQANKVSVHDACEATQGANDGRQCLQPVHPVRHDEHARHPEIPQVSKMTSCGLL
jgi:hypothetical protein